MVLSGVDGKELKTTEVMVYVCVCVYVYVRVCLCTCVCVLRRHGVVWCGVVWCGVVVRCGVV